MDSIWSHWLEIAVGDSLWIEEVAIWGSDFDLLHGGSEAMPGRFCPFDFFGSYT